MTTRLMADAGPGAASRVFQVVPGASIVAIEGSPGTRIAWPPGNYERLRYTHDPADWTADILDVEPAYAQHGLAPGTVYANVSRIGQVRQAAAGRPFNWWARRIGPAQPVPGAVAVQYAAYNTGSGFVDASIVTDPSWPHGGAAAQTNPPPPIRHAKPVPPARVRAPGPGPADMPGLRSGTGVRQQGPVPVATTPPATGTGTGDTSGTDTAAGTGESTGWPGWVYVVIVAAGLVLLWIIWRREKARQASG